MLKLVAQVEFGTRVVMPVYLYWNKLIISQ